MIRSDKEYEAALVEIEALHQELGDLVRELRDAGSSEDEIEAVVRGTKTRLDTLAQDRDLYEALCRDGIPAVPSYPPAERGKALIALRIARGLSQKRLAELLGVSEPQVSRDERTEYRGITQKRYARILEVLRVQEHVAGYTVRQTP